MAYKSTAEPSYDGTHVITQKKKNGTHLIEHQKCRNICDQTPEMPKHMRSNPRNTGTYLTKHKKYRNVYDQAEKNFGTCKRCSYHLCFLSTSLGVCGFTQSEREKCVLCESSTRLASEQRRRRHRSRQTLVVDLCFEVTQN